MTKRQILKLLCISLHKIRRFFFITKKNSIAQLILNKISKSVHNCSDINFKNTISITNENIQYRAKASIFLYTIITSIIVYGMSITNVANKSQYQLKLLDWGKALLEMHTFSILL